MLPPRPRSHQLLAGSHHSRRPAGQQPKAACLLVLLLYQRDAALQVQLAMTCVTMLCQPASSPSCLGRPTALLERCTRGLLLPWSWPAGGSFLGHPTGCAAAAGAGSSAGGRTGKQAVPVAPQVRTVLGVGRTNPPPACRCLFAILCRVLRPAVGSGSTQTCLPCPIAGMAVPRPALPGLCCLADSACRGATRDT